MSSAIIFLHLYSWLYRKTIHVKKIKDKMFARYLLFIGILLLKSILWRYEILTNGTWMTESPHDAMEY